MWWSVGDNVCAKLCSLEASGPRVGTCCLEFGNGCVTGYKHLWCQSWPGAPHLPVPSPTPPKLPVCNNKGQNEEQDWDEGDEEHSESDTD